MYTITYCIGARTAQFVIKASAVSSRSLFVLRSYGVCKWNSVYLFILSAFIDLQLGLRYCVLNQLQAYHIILLLYIMWNINTWLCPHRMKLTASFMPYLKFENNYIRLQCSRIILDRALVYVWYLIPSLWALVCFWLPWQMIS